MSALLGYFAFLLAVAGYFYAASSVFADSWTVALIAIFGAFCFSVLSAGLLKSDQPKSEKEVFEEPLDTPHKVAQTSNVAGKCETAKKPSKRRSRSWVDRFFTYYKANLYKFGIAFCLIAFLPWPTPFYMITRLAISATAALLAYQVYKAKPEEQQGWWVLMAACAVLFNPVFPFYLHSKLGWMLLDLAAAALFWKCEKIKRGQ